MANKRRGSDVTKGSQSQRYDQLEETDEREIESDVKEKRENKVPVLIVFGSGGHTAEMLQLIPSLSSDRFGPFSYIISRTDSTSEKRAKSSGVVPASAHFETIPRSREVGQSYFTAFFMTLWAIAVAFELMWRLKPRLILVNGPGTCLPICIAAVVLRWVRLSSTKIVFIESACRVQSLSATGKILYHGRLADSIMVQWRVLMEKYPRAECVGLLS
jgi:beta-1,4-N-acetylglucosaminyltransferase